MKQTDLEKKIMNLTNYVAGITRKLAAGEMDPVDWDIEMINTDKDFLSLISQDRQSLVEEISKLKKKSKTKRLTGLTITDTMSMYVDGRNCGLDCAIAIIERKK